LSRSIDGGVVFSRHRKDIHKIESHVTCVASHVIRSRRRRLGFRSGPTYFVDQKRCEDVNHGRQAERDSRRRRRVEGEGEGEGGKI